MKLPFSLILLALLSCRAEILAASPTNPDPSAPPNPAVAAALRRPDPGYGWDKRHAAVLEANKRIQPGIVMLGDSIIHLWGGEPAYPSNGAESWGQLFKDRSAVNAGFGSDCTQHLLWRIENGELDGITPEVLVFLIGTNNLTGQPNCSRATTPEETVAGVRACIATAQRKQPKAKVILVSLLPRADQGDALLPLVRATNTGLEALSKETHITFLNLYPQFLTKDGVTDQSLFTDGVHPNAKGYAIWAKALDELLDKLVR